MPLHGLCEGRSDYRESTCAKPAHVHRNSTTVQQIRSITSLGSLLHLWTKVPWVSRSHWWGSFAKVDVCLQRVWGEVNHDWDGLPQGQPNTTWCGTVLRWDGGSRGLRAGEGVKVPSMEVTVRCIETGSPESSHIDKSLSNIKQQPFQQPCCSPRGLGRKGKCVELSHFWCPRNLLRHPVYPSRKWNIMGLGIVFWSGMKRVRVHHLWSGFYLVPERNGMEQNVPKHDYPFLHESTSSTEAQYHTKISSITVISQTIEPSTRELCPFKIHHTIFSYTSLFSWNATGRRTETTSPTPPFGTEKVSHTPPPP